ncbi:hypothetical protein BC835DRAFT_1421641 [Cytidiella melzeri]|nr:hypothetical protein BC835DRAFT_1421641 [Cytidiella melzeri]
MPATLIQQSYPPINPASLIDPSLHSPALLELVHLKMSRTLIEYATDCIIEAVDYAMGKPSSSTRGRSSSRHHRHADFLKFVTNVLTKAEVKVPVLLVALVYVDRAKPHLQIALEQWACERVFMGALILANKYCNDSTLKNVHWALCTGVFGKRDIGRIEREFLDVLDYELSLHESDLLSHHDAIMSLVQPSSRQHVRSHVHHHHHHQHQHQHVKFTPTAAEGQSTTWSSSGSSSTDEDSSSDDDDMACSSRSVSPMPATPSHVSLPVATTTSSTKSTAAIATEPKVVLVSSSSSSTSHHHHHRLSSALHLLKSFPMPHFHHAHSTTTSSSSSSSLGEGGSSSSSSREVSPASRSSSLVESGLSSMAIVAAAA